MIYRKICLVALTVFTDNWDPQTQILVGIGFVLTSLSLDQAMHPYKSQELNQIHLLSQIVVAITLYCGLYYVSGSLSYDARMALLTIMVLINLSFFILWFYRSVPTSTFPSLKRFFRSSSEKVKLHPISPLPNTSFDPEPEILESDISKASLIPSAKKRTPYLAHV